MPEDLKNYFRYVLGKSGGDGFTENDQKNVAGNQLGSYLFAIEKDFEKIHLEFRISHPFDDRSGMELDNFKDNLYSLYLRKNRAGSFIDEFLFEFLYTKNQSGNPAKDTNKIRGGDNYFNNWSIQHRVFL